MRPENRDWIPKTGYREEKKQDRLRDTGYRKERNPACYGLRFPVSGLRAQSENSEIKRYKFREKVRFRGSQNDNILNYSHLPVYRLGTTRQNWAESGRNSAELVRIVSEQGTVDKDRSGFSAATC